MNLVNSVSFWALYGDWLRGRYQVRRDPQLSVTRRYSEIEATLSRKAGIVRLELTVPFGTRVALRSGPVLRVLWDGTRLLGATGAKQTLKLDLDSPTLWCEIRTASGSVDWVRYGGAVLIQSSGKRVLQLLKGMFKQRRGIAAALLVHSLALLLTWEGLWRQADQAGADVFTPIEMAAAPSEPEVAQPETVASEISQADAFSGSFDRAFSRLDRFAKTARPTAAAKVSQGGSGWKGLFSGFRSAPAGVPQVRATQAGGKSTLLAGDSEILSEMIRKNQERTRSCYERALLVDETLAVDAQFEGDLVASGGGARLAAGRYTLKGDGSADARQSLTRCLDQVLGSSELPARFRGVTLRYQFMFKS